MYTNTKTNQFPYTDYDLRKDNPNVSFPKDITDELRAEFDMVPVVPATDVVGKVRDTVTCELISGVWTEVVTWTDPSAEVVKAGYSMELSELDTFIPRGLEDQWAVTNFDVTLLPQVQQDRLARKIELRALLKA